MQRTRSSPVRVLILMIQEKGKGPNFDSRLLRDSMLNSFKLKAVEAAAKAKRLYVDETGLDDDDDDEVNMKSRHRRGSLTLTDSLTKFDFDMNVGFRNKNTKHISYEQAKLREAMMKLRHVEDVEDTGDSMPKVSDEDGSVTFQGKRYAIVPTCSSSVGSPGCKCCDRAHEPSDFEKLGIGVVLYFKFLKIMAVCFFVLTIIASVQFIIFENAGALKAELDGQEGFASLAFLSMGNLGEGKTVCTQESVGGDLKVFCPTGQTIGAIKEVHYGETSGMCQCPQYGSAEETTYGASQPPSLTDPNKCGSNLPFLGRDPTSAGRCCSKLLEPSGKGNFTSLKFRDNKWCKSSVRARSNAETRLAAACAAASFDAESQTYAFNIVQSACIGKQSCTIGVDDFTQWNQTTQTLEQCTANVAANCSMALGSVDPMGVNTFSNCSTETLKTLTVVALCFDKEAEIFGVKTTKQELWVFLTTAEMLTIMVLLFFIWLISVSQNTDVQAIDRSVLTLTDFSIAIPSLPCVDDEEFFTSNDIGDRIVDTSKLEVTIRNHLEEYLTSRPAVGINNSVVKSEKLQIKVHDIHFGKGDGKLIKLRKKRGTLLRKIDHEKGHLVQVASKGRDTTHLDSTIAELQHKLLTVDEKIALEKQEASVNRPVCAYITFSRNEGRLRMIDNYPNTLLGYCCQPCCKGKESLLLGRYRYWVEDAPEPENIWWENLAVSKTNRCLRKTLSALVTLVLLIASIGGISYVKGFNSKLSRMYPPVDCKSLTAQYGGKITKIDVELDELQLDRIDLAQMRSHANASTSADHLAHDYRLIRKPTKDNAFQCFCQAVLLSPTDSINNYIFNPPKDFVEANITASGPWNYTYPYADTNPNGDWCVKYLGDYASITGLTFGSVLLVLVINSVLKQCMKRLVKFEKPKSKGEYALALANKLFIVQLINTALVVLIVNGNLESFGSESVGTAFDFTLSGTIFSGDHPDFNKSWFTTVGTSLCVTMIINLATPFYSPVGNCVFRGLARMRDRAKHLCCCGDKEFTKKLTQTEYNALWDGGEFELPARYGAIQMVFWVTMMYGSGLPIMYPIACAFYFFAFWVDKWAITKLYNRPAHSDGRLAQSLTHTMVYGVLLHAILACWKYSNSRLFEGVDIIQEVQQLVGMDLSAIEDASQMMTCGVGGFTFVVSRVTISVPHIFVFTLLILVYLVVMRIVYPIFGTVLLGMFPCLLRCCDSPSEDTSEDIAECEALVGPRSYDLTANREYAKAFGLDAETSNSAGSDVTIDPDAAETDVEMVQLTINNSGEDDVLTTRNDEVREKGPEKGEVVELATRNDSGEQT